MVAHISNWLLLLSQRRREGHRDQKTHENTWLVFLKGGNMPQPYLDFMAHKFVTYTTFKRSWPDVVTGGSMTAILLSTLELQGKKMVEVVQLVGVFFYSGLQSQVGGKEGLSHAKCNTSYFVPQLILCRFINWAKIFQYQCLIKMYSNITRPWKKRKRNPVICYIDEP